MLHRRKLLPAKKQTSEYCVSDQTCFLPERERRPAATVGMETDKFWLIDIWLSFTAIQKVPLPFIGELYLHLNSLLILTSSLRTGGFEFYCMIFLVKLSLLAPYPNSSKLINLMPNRSWLPTRFETKRQLNKVC